MKNVALITGGAGFIGSNTAKFLLDEGWKVIILDNLSRKGVKKNLSWLSKNYPSRQIETEIVDIRDFKTVKKSVKKADVVYHFAGQVAVTTSIASPLEDFEINALGTLNVLEAARLSGHKPIIIYSSSNKVYGQLDKMKTVKKNLRYSFLKGGISETYPVDFHSPYGCSKGTGDMYVRDYARVYGLPTVVFRQSCIYGPRQWGMVDQGWVAHIASEAIKGNTINIFGDGRQTRDLLHIDDLIKGYSLAIKNIKISSGSIYNIGGGIKHSFSLLEYIEFLQKFFHKKIRVKYFKQRAGDQKVFISDTTKIQKDLSWSVEVCHLKGLEDLIKWVSDNSSKSTAK